MKPEPSPAPRSFALTPERPIPVRHRIARAMLILYFVTLLAASVVLCACPGFYVLMAVFAAVALACGSRGQRILAAALFVVAVTAAIFMYLAEQRSAELGKQAKERMEQQQMREIP